MWSHISQDSNNEISVLIYIPNFLDKKTYEYVESFLDNKKDCFKSGTNLNGNEILRKQLWFQRDEKYFCEKWKSRLDRWKSEKYENLLLNLQNIIKNKLKEINLKALLENYTFKKEIIDNNFDFNSCLINLYRNGDDFIAPHRDSILSFGEYPTIVGLSIGASRIMKIKKNKLFSTNANLSTEFEVENNSVFIMMGASQKYYTHEILREPEIKDKRFSLTFRNWLG